MLDPQELADLKTRCVQAMTLGFEIARAEHYAALLGAKPGDVTEVAKNSPAHLLELIAKAEGKTEAPKAKKKAEKVEEKAEKVEKKAEKVEEKAEKVEKKAEKVEEKAEKVEKKAEKVEEKAEKAEKVEEMFSLVELSEAINATASVEAPAKNHEASKETPADLPKKGKKSSSDQ
jgi:uncharacterized protein (DUF3084 family)